MADVAGEATPRSLREDEGGTSPQNLTKRRDTFPADENATPHRSKRYGVPNEQGTHTRSDKSAG